MALKNALTSQLRAEFSKNIPLHFVRSNFSIEANPISIYFPLLLFIIVRPSITMSHTGMSACCISGSVHEGNPKGREDTIGGLDCYISEPKDGSKNKSIIFLVDSTVPNFP